MQKPRARALGLPFRGTTGALNAITDVAGVTVGFTTLTDPALEMQTGAVLTKTEINGEAIDPLYLAAVQAAEEAVVNAIVAGEDVATFKPKGQIVPGFDTNRLAALF